jgi:hypothetical protein
VSTVKAEVREFGTGCVKCRAAAGIRSYCVGCQEIRGRDHFHCACTVCGYAWAEKPADAQKDKPKNGAKR